MKTVKLIALNVVKGLIFVGLFTLGGAPHWAAFMGAMLMINTAKATTP